jgi:hypothetical protein
MRCGVVRSGTARLGQPKTKRGVAELDVEFPSPRRGLDDPQDLHYFLERQYVI